MIVEVPLAQTPWNSKELRLVGPGRLLVNALRIMRSLWFNGSCVCGLRGPLDQRKHCDCQTTRHVY
jgi:hypothetical protein